MTLRAIDVAASVAAHVAIRGARAVHAGLVPDGRRTGLLHELARDGAALAAHRLTAAGAGAQRGAVVGARHRAAGIRLRAAERAMSGRLAAVVMAGRSHRTEAHPLARGILTGLSPRAGERERRAQRDGCPRRGRRVPAAGGTEQRHPLYKVSPRRRGLPVPASNRRWQAAAHARPFHDRLEEIQHATGRARRSRPTRPSANLDRCFARGRARRRAR